MKIYNLNEKIFILINQKMANPFLDFLILWILIPLFSLLILIPLFFLFSKEKEKKFIALFSLFSGFFLYWIGHSILKPIFDIPRPFILIEGTRLIGPWHSSSYSFPSTTTMLAFGLALPFFIHKFKTGKLLLILGLFLGFSVIYTGFHTPLDVFAGILFSLFFVLLFNKILYNFKGKNEN